MTFTIKPNRANVQWIKRNTEKETRKVEAAALDRWTTDGGSIIVETSTNARKIVFVYRKHKQKHYRVALANSSGKKDTPHNILKTRILKPRKFRLVKRL